MKYGKISFLPHCYPISLGRYFHAWSIQRETHIKGMIGFVYAVFAGFCAATASTCAKLAMSPELQRNFWCDLLLQRVAESPSLSSVCETVSYPALILTLLK